MVVSTSQIDPSLLPFLDANNAPEEAAALARLNTEEIEPTIRRGLGYKVGFARPELEELYNDIQLRLLKRLRALKQDPAGNQIVNLRGYVATVTRNTCDEYGSPDGARRYRAYERRCDRAYRCRTGCVRAAGPA